MCLTNASFSSSRGYGGVMLEQSRSSACVAIERRLLMVWRVDKREHCRPRSAILCTRKRPWLVESGQGFDRLAVLEPDLHHLPCSPCLSHISRLDIKYVTVLLTIGGEQAAANYTLCPSRFDEFEAPAGVGSARRAVRRCGGRKSSLCSRVSKRHSARF